MTVLTAEQIAYYERKLGTPVDQADIIERIDRMTAEGIYTADIDVVVEILETRRATLANTPESFAIPGEYSQSTVGNMKLLDRQIADALAEQASGEDVEGGFVYVQPPFNVRPERTAFDTEEWRVRNRNASCYGR